MNVGGNGEGAAVGTNGLIYVALEDKDEVAAFDPKTLEVKHYFSLSGVRAPTGLAVDVKNDRIFVGGHSKMMAVLDGFSGKQITSVPTGCGTNAAGFDANNHLIFFSNGAGNLTVIEQKTPDKYVAREPVITQASAKTMAFDKKTEKIFLPAAAVVMTPAADASQKSTKTITEGTFCILVVGK